MQAVIQCKNITHYYGMRLIYENLNFEVHQGKILGLLGKNGTGKTTMFTEYPVCCSIIWIPVMYILLTT